MVTTKPRADAISALAVYSESLVADRHVVVFGPSRAGLRDLLAELGARAVVEIAPGDEPVALRTRPFDVAIVTSATSFGAPGELLARVRRALTDEGVAVVSAGDELDYYQLFDLVAGAFEEVRMVAQLPFRGVALVELGGDAPPSVSVDTQLADADREPEGFVAVASRVASSIEPYVIVELPSEDEGRTLARAPGGGALAEALAQEKLRADALRTQLELAEGRATAAEEIQAALQLRTRQLIEMEAALAEERAEAEEGRAAVIQLEEAALQLQESQRFAAAAEGELARVVQAHALELARFEDALRERAQAIRLLEAEVVRRDRLVRELVDSLDVVAHEGRSPDAASLEPTPLTDELARENSILHWRLDALALELARRDAEAQAGEWAIQELEHELAREAAAHEAAEEARDAASLGTARPAEGDAARRLAEALDELDALRIALTQEHAARVRAESGEELARARAEVQRQATLLEQLGRELEVARAPHPEVR